MISNGVLTQMCINKIGSDIYISGSPQNGCPLFGLIPKKNSSTRPSCKTLNYEFIDAYDESMFHGECITFNFTGYKGRDDSIELYHKEMKHKLKTENEIENELIDPKTVKYNYEELNKEIERNDVIDEYKHIPKTIRYNYEELNKEIERSNIIDEYKDIPIKTLSNYDDIGKFLQE